MKKPDIRNIPYRPGIYKFKNSKGNVLYVGKAKSLRKRVASYFTAGNNSNPRLPLLLKEAKDIECIVTSNEVEALILENNLIKQFKPRFNIRLRDDKQYPYLKISEREKYPRLSVTRKIKDDGASYYGPYTSVSTVKDVIKVVMKVFAVCTCKQKFTANMKPCLNYQMEMCSAPCAGITDEREYAESVENLRLFLEGRINELLKTMKKKMSESSSLMLYEKAAFYRDGIESIKTLSQIQSASINTERDKDCIVLRSYDSENIFLVLTVRDGKIINQKHYIIKSTMEATPSESIESFIKQYYTGPSNIPFEILTEEELCDARNISEWLSSAKKKKVIFHTPKRGRKLSLLKMASINADYVLENHIKRIESWNKILGRMQKKFALKLLPDCIDAVDISNLSGKQSVGAVIRWREGELRKNDYRKYAIKWKEGIDDFLMIEEVVTRHLARIIKDKRQLPSLLLIDGGKGQVNHAVDALKRYPECSNISVIGIMKGRKYSRNKNIEPAAGYSPEEIVLPDRNNSLRLEKSSAVLLLLQSIRDEVHRFVIQYHRKLRKNKFKISVLDSVKGIGKKRKIRLLKEFGSIKAMKEVSAGEISRRGGVNIKIAEEVVKVIQRPSFND